MQEMDNVQVIVEKEKYARDGVHKGMFGWICYPKCVEGNWLVNFPQCGEKDEQIKAQFENPDDSTKSYAKPAALSGFMI